VFYPEGFIVYAAQAGLGAALAVIPPAIAAISLGIVGRRLMPTRVARNETFNHAGNLTAAVLAGALGHYVGVQWIFYLVAVFAVSSAVIVLLIKLAEIDHELARGGEQETKAGTCEPLSIRAVITKRLTGLDTLWPIVSLAAAAFVVAHGLTGTHLSAMLGARLGRQAP